MWGDTSGERPAQKPYYRKIRSCARNSSVNVGIIGLGMISNAHCAGYLGAGNCTLVAGSDLIDGRRQEAARRYGIEVYSEYRDLLRRDDIEIVSICTPDPSHASIALEAISAGKHVMIEKPMALTLEDCDKIIDAAKSNKVAVSTTFTYRFNPFFRHVKDLIDRRQIGELAATSIFYFRRLYHPKPEGWIKRPYANMVTQESVHYFDILRWFAGEVRSLSAISNKVRPDYEYDQVLYCNMRFASGAIGQLSHTILGFHIRHILWAVGTRGVAYGELVFPHVTSKESYGRVMFKEHDRESSKASTEEKLTTASYDYEHVIDDLVIPTLIKDFVDRVSDSRAPSITVVDARAAIELCLALQSSVKDRRAIDLPLRS